MKRKALVAAIAGILSAPAVAAIDDAGMKYTSASEGFYGSIRANLRIEDDKDANLANDLESSRLGVQGSVDLGGGMEATYRYEWDIETDEFASVRLRQVGLTGDFGTLNFGQQWNVDYDYVLGSTDVGNSATGNLAEAFRWGSSARYDSNDLNGFKFSGQVQMDGSGKDDDDDVDMYALGASYHTAGFTVSGTYLGEKGAETKAPTYAVGYRAPSAPDNDLRLAAPGVRSGLALAVGVDENGPDDMTGNEDRDRDNYTFTGEGLIGFFNSLTEAQRLAIGCDDADGDDDNTPTGAECVSDSGSALDVTHNGVSDDSDNTIGIGLGYGQDNWQVNYFFKQSDAPGVEVVYDNDENDDGTTGDPEVDVIYNRSGEETAHSIAGQVSFDRLTFRGIYEMREWDANLDAFDTSIFIGEVQYDLGSRSRVWLGFKNTDDDAAADEVTLFNLGYRVDF